VKTFTVQCGYAAYYFRTETVEAETPDAAMEKAIAAANDSAHWSSADVCGNTFIDAVAEGDDVDLWSDDVTQLAVPPRLTERGEGPRVIVIVSGGVVQGVSIDGGYARVEVRDYDNGTDPSDSNIKTDAEGRRYALTDWSNAFSWP
jgi:hypothetical protein